MSLADILDWVVCMRKSRQCAWASCNICGTSDCSRSQSIRWLQVCQSQGPSKGTLWWGHSIGKWHTPTSPHLLGRGTLRFQQRWMCLMGQSCFSLTFSGLCEVALLELERLKENEASWLIINQLDVSCAYILWFLKLGQRCLNFPFFVSCWTFSDCHCYYWRHCCESRSEAKLVSSHPMISRWHLQHWCRVLVLNFEYPTCSTE